MKTRERQALETLRDIAVRMSLCNEHKTAQEIWHAIRQLEAERDETKKLRARLLRKNLPMK